MNKIAFALSALASAAVAAEKMLIPELIEGSLAEGNEASDHWAVIVAGSKGYYNYRHQSDAAHAYQLLKANGIPPEQIIYFSYDDVPYDSDNPFKGQLFNKTHGSNVYDADAIDYKGDQVDPSIFHAVLRGDEATAGGKVLKTDENSKVFIFYTDHGSPGVLQMPTGQPIWADELQASIDYMYDNKMYNEMVIFVEACESGSMFPNLTDDKNVYAVTATDGENPSYAAYCYPGGDKIGRRSIGACLGDLFSVSWMEDAEANNISSENFDQQFEKLKTLVDKSEVQKFGDFNMMSDVTGEYIGTVDAPTNPSISGGEVSPHVPTDLDWFYKGYTVNSRDIKLSFLHNKVMIDGNRKNQKDLQDEIDYRIKVLNLFEATFPKIIKLTPQELEMQPTNFECLRRFYNVYEDKCGGFEDYSFQYFKYLVHACETQTEEKLDSIESKLVSLCDLVFFPPQQQPPFTQ